MKEKLQGASKDGLTTADSDTNLQGFKDQLVSSGKNLGAEQIIKAADTASKAAGEPVQKAVSKASTIRSYVDTAYQLGNSLTSNSGADSNRFSNAPTTVEQESESLSDATPSNASAIATHTIFGVSHLVSLKIMVEGNELKYYKSFELSQSARGHHSFRLILSHDSLGSEETYQLEKAQTLLGKRLLVSFHYKNILEKPERDFIGVVTEVSFQQDHGSKGYVVLAGYSPTILLDGAPHVQSFGGSHPVPLNTVVNQLLEEGYSQGGKYNYEVKSSKNFNLSYSCQYNETHYNFLARTAEAYGEQFFYDGEILHFGDLPLGDEPIKLIYGRDVENVQIKMQTRHVNRQLFGYNSSTNEKLSPGARTELTHAASIAQAAYEISQSTYSTPSLQIAPIKASTNKDVEMAQRSISGSVGVDVFVTSGITTVPFLYPGCVVELNMLKPGTSESNYFTKLMITQIDHQVDGLGHYKGHFEGIASDTGFIPTPDFKLPVAEQQVATVVSNSDPENKGRIQVQFDWQNGDLNTEFIRMMTPDAGSSDKVGKNRGFVAIPEVGDQVMVGFVQQHPDRPFVMGGMFHGQAGGGGGSGNNVKSLSSKSGHILEFDDAGGITLADKNKNKVYLSGTGDIAVTSSNTITLNTGQSTIEMKEDGSIEISGVEIKINGAQIASTATEELLCQSGGANMTLTAAGDQAVVSGTESTLSGKNTVTVTGGSEATLTAQGTTNVEGAIVKLN